MSFTSSPNSKAQGLAIRHVLKRVGERALVGAGFCRFARWQNPNRVSVITYHNIVPADSPRIGDESLHLPVDVYSAQLRELAKSHDIVRLDQLCSASREGNRPRAAITFDDAYAGAVDLGVEELVRLQLPATIFVAPGLLGRQELWWDRLGSRPDFLTDERNRALHELRGDDRLVRAEYEPVGRADLPAYARTCTVDELLAASEQPLISVGSHGWSHRNLAVLADTEVRFELERSLSWLEERMPDAMTRWVTYPYGLASEEVQAIASQLGFLGGFLSGGGGFDCSETERRPFALPRVNIPRGLSIDGFRIRATGINLL